MFLLYIEFKDEYWILNNKKEISCIEFSILNHKAKPKRNLPIDASAGFIEDIKRYKRIYTSYLTLFEIRHIEIHSKGIDEIINELTELEIDKIFCHKCIRVIFVEVDKIT